ncbi:unnamed protein product [Discula destructiva]
MTEHPSTAVLASPPGPSGVVKKKFAAPPVKSACLACRAARTRCDGAKPCVTCQSRSRECIYTPSRRGGPRARKKPRPPRDATEDEVRQIPDNVYAMLSQEPVDAPRDPISIQAYIDPGAGLKHLEDWVQDSDFIFDSLFINGTDPAGSNGFTSDVSGAQTPSNGMPVVRTYRSDAAILQAYYVFIHPYLPILPPPATIPVDQPVPRLQNQIDLFEERYEPSSPITLAISAILALIPCPEDTYHQAHESQLFRRKYAQYFAQSAFETIENDEEIPDSSIEPTRALSEEHKHTSFRRPFHPQVPVELEAIIALDILSVYEYAQRGNLKKMQNRAGQALMSAMDLFLHSCRIEDEFAEARRRVWWMSYICIAQAAIVGNTKPSFLVFSPSYTADFPTFMADPEAFTVYIQAQRAILAATQFVIELNKAVKEGADMDPIYAKMKELEAFLEPQLSRSESWLLPATTTSPVDSAEEVVARSLRCMASIKLNSARIKVHRYCAFFDIPVFSRKHCDLKSLNTSDEAEPRQWPTCSCSSFTNPFATSGAAATPNGSHTSAATAGLSPSSDGTCLSSSNNSVPYSIPPSCSGSSNNAQPLSARPPAPPMPTINFPFSSHQSAKICLKSALAIAHSFDELPFPSPTGTDGSGGGGGGGGPIFLSPMSAISCPRTMPSFACCAMQCAYALLMVHQKTKTLYGANNYSTSSSKGPYEGAGSGPGPLAVNTLLVRLQQGLTSIYGTLSNYATAFEALGGMRDQIRSAVEDSAAFAV